MTKKGTLKNNNPPHTLTTEEQRKAGLKSVEVRRQKKTVQNILQSICDSKCDDIPQFSKIASKLGIEGSKSVKELFTLVSTLNSLKQAKMDELGKMAELLGEQREMQSGNEEEQADMLEAIKRAVKNED